MVAEMVERRNGAEEEERLGVYRAVEQREQKRGQQPDGSLRVLIVVQHFERKTIQIDECAKERPERNQRTGERERRCRATQQTASDAHQQRIRRKEHDVLLIDGTIGNVLVAIDRHGEIPTRVPARLEIQELVVLDDSPRHAALAVANRDDREVAYKENGQARADERARGGPRRPAAPAPRDARRQIPIHWCPRRVEVAGHAKRDRPDDRAVR